ncbi:hypothetical protein Ddye_004034 [Dipteronia dyeriana]|uniref:Uncharacterized protein n=1 Tax=Dipteronia dyeriana TaxID=168575 RepID=A0AAD9XTV8_9ROSI|nr:hypothetical protein Ddye_004034 [Dipteronia dyeriana]
MIAFVFRRHVFNYILRSTKIRLHNGCTHAITPAIRFMPACPINFLHCLKQLNPSLLTLLIRFLQGPETDQLTVSKIRDGELQYLNGVQLDGSDRVERLRNRLSERTEQQCEKLLNEIDNICFKGVDGSENVDEAVQELPDASLVRLQVQTTAVLLIGGLLVSLAARQQINALLNRDTAFRLGSNTGANEIKQHPLLDKLSNVKVRR